MGPLNDENKLQVDEKNNKNRKIEKSLKIIKMYIVNFKTINWLLRVTSLIQS